MRLRTNFFSKLHFGRISEDRPLKVKIAPPKISMIERKQTEKRRRKHGLPNYNAEYMKIGLYVQTRLYLLTSIIGDTEKPFNSYKGHIGRIIWILNLIIHFSLDFWEAAYVFHVSWATSIGIYFCAFVICTIFTIRHSVPWYVKAIGKLAKEGHYNETFKMMKFVFKYFPYVMVCVSLSGAGAQFGCYAYDDALSLSFDKIFAGNSTMVVPKSVEVIINILRMTSLIHIFYAFWFYLLFHLIMLYTIQSSMKEFNERMKEELKTQPPSITFPDAVNMFAKRTKLLRQCSAKSTVVLSTLIVATSVSFVVNAYNFLFLRRFAIYIWFALAPLIWLVSPLVFAASITSTYRNLKYDVIQAWVEIPEVFDEVWDRETEKGGKVGAKRGWAALRGGMNKQTSNVLRTKETKESVQDQQIGQKSARISLANEIDGQTETEKSFLTPLETDKGGDSQRERSSSNASVVSSATINVRSNLDEEVDKKQITIGLSNNKGPRPGSSKLGTVVNVAKAVGQLQRRTKIRKKFNYEKYIKYLETILITIGFSVSGVMVTWDRVSFFSIVLFTMVGVFAQAAFLKK